MIDIKDLPNSYQEDIKKAVNILYVVSLIATISFILVKIIITLLG